MKKETYKRENLKIVGFEADDIIATSAVIPTETVPPSTEVDNAKEQSWSGGSFF